jgi:hypothetical protein
MLLSDIRGAIARRWYLALLGILGTIGLCFAATTAVPVTYQAKALVVLLPPRTLININGNPFLALGGLDSAAGVLSRSMTSQQTTESLEGLSPTSHYAVDPDPSTSGPVLAVLVDGKDPSGALQTLNTVLAAIPTRLALLQRQNGAPANSLITASVVTRDTTPAVVSKAQIRALLVAAAGGLTGTLFITALIDTGLTRRSSRNRPAPDPDVSLGASGVFLVRGNRSPESDDPPEDDEVQVKVESRGHPPGIVQVKAESRGHPASIAESRGQSAGMDEPTPPVRLTGRARSEWARTARRR